MAVQIGHQMARLLTAVGLGVICTRPIATHFHRHLACRSLLHGHAYLWSEGRQGNKTSNHDGKQSVHPNTIPQEAFQVVKWVRKFV